MLDVNGEAVELVYDPDNSTQTVLDVFGNPTTYVYDERGNVVTEVDAVGLVTRRTYDEDNNVLTETVVTEESGVEGWTTTYTYDGEGNKLSETDPLGNVTRWSYNRLGQVLTETDALGQTTTYSYDSRGNLLSTKDANGNVTEFNYDLRGNLLSLKLGDSIKTFEYYSDGNVKNIEDNLGNQATYTYSPNGETEREAFTIVTPEGDRQVETTWVYDNEGRIKSILKPDNQIEYQYDEVGNQVHSITRGEQTDYLYNPKGQLVETIYPDDTPDNPNDNSRRITVYDGGGRERATINMTGRVTHYEYDAAGRLRTTIYDSSSDAVENLVAAIAPGKTLETIDWTEAIYPDQTPTYLASLPHSSTEYYQNGWVKAEIDFSGNRIEYKYDPLGRQTEVRYDETNYVTYTYDKAGNRRTETYHAQGTTLTNVYDELGQLTTKADQNNHTTQYEYDENGQLIAVIDARGGRTEYEYDDKGNLKSVKDALSQVTTYEYDEKNRQTTIIRTDGKRSTNIYNDAENSVTITDFNGKSIKYVYDEQGNLKDKEFLSDGTSVSYDYDAETRTETYTSDRGTTVYQYDEGDRLISRTDPTGPYLPNGTSIEYEYDGGSIVAVKTPENVTTYTYESGLLKTVTNQNIGTTTYFYESDNTFKTQFPNNVLETRSYDELGRLKRIETAKIDPVTGENVEIISSYDYQLDDVGNRLSVTEHSDRQVKYEYDELNRVIKEEILNDPDGNNRVITYTYDAVGNRLEKNDSIEGVTTYTYNQLNQLQMETTNGVTTTYTYDDNGNLISDVTGNYSTTYHWENDGENRLVGVTIVDENGTQNIEYQYNARGIRVGEIVDGVETRFLIDDLRPYAQVLAEYDAAGNVQTAYTYGYDLISQQRGESELFYHADALGSSRVLTSENGEVTNTYTYDAYGNLIQSVGSIENSYLFAGEQRDFETGLDYLRARYYDPTIGRFISADAYDGTLSDPMSQHKYQYAHANPVINTDPSGYFSLAEIGTAIAVSGIFAGLGITTLGAAGVLIGGGSLGDAAARYDQFLAGFADIATFGVSTKLRSKLYGDTATRDHRGLFFNLGRFSGGLVGFGLGLSAPTALSGTNWAQKIAVGYDLFGSGFGSYQSTRKFLEGRGTVWDLLAYLPLLTYTGGLSLDWLATKGIILSDLNITEAISTGVGRSGSITPEQLPPFLQRNLVGSVSEWWLDLRDLIVLYRGQRQGTTPILSPLARERGIEASEELVRRMRAEGFSDQQIAGYTARWHNQPVPEMFVGSNLGGEPLGAVGIPTTRLPGLASSYAGPDGVTFVIRLPKEKAIIPAGWTGLAAESEYIVLNQIPNQNIVEVIPASNIPYFDLDGFGNIIIPSR
jgi:RHS repeat-associated protein